MLGAAVSGSGGEEVAAPVAPGVSCGDGSRVTGCVGKEVGAEVSARVGVAVAGSVDAGVPGEAEGAWVVTSGVGEAGADEAPGVLLGPGGLTAWVLVSS